MILFGSFFLIFLVFVKQLKAEIHTGGILFPRETETRQVISLDGLWNFVVANYTKPLLGLEQEWFKKDLRDVVNESDLMVMPVPSSYNDITTDWKIRDYVGLVWYDRKFFAPKYWLKNTRVWLRFGSVCYAAQVWVNGQLAMSHEIGHLPFVGDITAYLNFGGKNRITVAVDNTLSPSTLPEGSLYKHADGRKSLSYRFDFFHYAGIDRPVKLYTTPKTYIDDITVMVTKIVDKQYALIKYDITVRGETNLLSCRVNIVDKRKFIAASRKNATFSGVITLEKPNLWWPYLMHPYPGYMYSLEVELLDSEDELVDKYILPIGIRNLSWTNKQMLINEKPIYFHGFGRHEDSDIRGKGLDLPLILRDNHLMKWIGANSFRTTHYPYAEEIMDLADESGFMVIDECPAANIDSIGEKLLLKHKVSVAELIKRDKNRPSVIMWSAANEASSGKKEAREYFRQIFELIRSLDSTRPTTIVNSVYPEDCYATQYADIININRYYGWYQGSGDLESIIGKVLSECRRWHARFNKPVIIQEFGGDFLDDLHFLPAFQWSVEYNRLLLAKHFEAFDRLRKEGFFIGEFVWNFADFQTLQDYTRVGGNKKGVFTRNRQPKSNAHYIRKRYWSLAKQYSNVSLPEDLESYVVNTTVTHVHSEL